MADEAKLPEETPAAPAEQAPETPTEPTPEVSDKKPEEAKTVAEILNPEAPAPRMVPEAALLDYKKGKKEADKRIKELEAQIAAGATKQEVSEGLDDVSAIFDKYGLDDANKEFFKEFTKAVESKNLKEIESLKSQLSEVTEKEKRDKFDKVFSKHFKEALERNPEYEKVANPSVIKTLSLAPENADKTFDEIIEIAYGGVVTGKRTIETTTPGGGKAPEPIDYERAKTDGAYVTEILKDPVRKAEYNKKMIERLQAGG